MIKNFVYSIKLFIHNLKQCVLSKGENKDACNAVVFLSIKYFFGLLLFFIIGCIVIPIYVMILFMVLIFDDFLYTIVGFIIYFWFEIRPVLVYHIKKGCKTAAGSPFLQQSRLDAGGRWRFG